MKTLLVTLLALASAGAVSAQVKIAVINTQKALLETDEIKKAQREMEAKFKPRQDQMVKLQKDLEDIRAQLNSGKLNELGTQELQTEGQRKQRELQRDAAGHAGRRRARTDRNFAARRQPDAGSW